MFNNDGFIYKRNTSFDKKRKSRGINSTSRKQERTMGGRNADKVILNRKVQDKAGSYPHNGATIILEKSGDQFWTICKEDADRLSNEQLYAYMFKRFGLHDFEIEIIRPK